MTQLIKYEAARHALQVAHSVDEVKDIRDKAQAMALYAKQANDTALVEWATEIKVRAERRAGEMLAEIGVKPGNPQLSHDRTIGPKLDELGITRNQSSRWQKLAAVPEAQFEQAVAAAKEVAGEVTTAALLRLREKPEPKKKPAPISTVEDDLREQIATLKQALEDVTETAETVEAFKNKSEVKTMNALRAELRAVKNRRDELMRENVELRKQIKYWQKKAEKK